MKRVRATAMATLPCVCTPRRRVSGAVRLPLLAGGICTACYRPRGAFAPGGKGGGSARAAVEPPAPLRFRRTWLLGSLLRGTLAVKRDAHYLEVLRNPGRGWLGRAWWWLSYRRASTRRSPIPGPAWTGWAALRRSA